MKTTISVPDDVFDSADALAQRMDVSRSWLYATAIAEYIAKHRQTDTTAKLDEVYADESGAVDPAVLAAQRRSLAKPTRRFAVFMLLLAGLAVVGCGGERFPLAPVAGRVTLDGEPLADARVSFEPIRVGDAFEAGPGSYATTGADGRYTLTTVDDRDGAVVAEHRVAISTFKGKEGPQGEMLTAVEERVPEAYGAQGTLRFAVPPEGTDAADFALELPGE